PALCQGAAPVSRSGEPPLLRPVAARSRVRVTVFGATGTVGQALLPLLADHEEVVAVSRRPRAAQDGIRWATADVSSGEGITDAIEGADVLYYLVHSLGEGDFEARDRQAAARVSREAARAGVRQISYLG